MIAAAVTFLGGIVGPKAAKPALIALGVIALTIGLGVAKCTYDRSVIANHENATTAKMLPKLREADAGIVNTVTATDAQIARDEQELRHAIDANPIEPLTARQRARSCGILLRQGAPGTPAPAGCVPASGAGAAAQP